MSDVIQGNGAEARSISHGLEKTRILCKELLSYFLKEVTCYAFLNV